MLVIDFRLTKFVDLVRWIVEKKNKWDF